MRVRDRNLYSLINEEANMKVLFKDHKHYTLLGTFDASWTLEVQCALHTHEIDACSIMM